MRKFFALLALGMLVGSPARAAEHSSITTYYPLGLSVSGPGVMTVTVDGGVGIRGSVGSFHGTGGLGYANAQTGNAGGLLGISFGFGSSVHLFSIRMPAQWTVPQGKAASKSKGYASISARSDVYATFGFGGGSWTDCVYCSDESNSAHATGLYIGPEIEFWNNKGDNSSRVFVGFNVAKSSGGYSHYAHDPWGLGPEADSGGQTEAQSILFRIDHLFGGATARQKP